MVWIAWRKLLISRRLLGERPLSLPSLVESYTCLGAVSVLRRPETRRGTSISEQTTRVFQASITVLSSGRLSWRNFFFFLQDWGYWKSFVRKEQTQPKFGPQNEKGFRSGNEVRLVHKIYSFVTDIDCFNILTMLFWTNRLEEMSNDNQRLQLSIEQKNGKIRTLENKYGCRTGVTCNIGNRTCNM